MTEEKVITLNVDRKNFEEIYFSNNQGSLFFSPTTKSKTITTLIVIVVFFAVLAFKNQLSEKNVGILYFISFLFLLCAVYLSLGINKVSRWKKQVNGYLKTLENAERYELKISDENFKVNLNNEEEISEWKDFKYYEITNDFISLEGNYNYMFPKKSMTDKNYTLLKQAIKKNIEQ